MSKQRRIDQLICCHTPFHVGPDNFGQRDPNKFQRAFIGRMKRWQKQYAIGERGLNCVSCDRRYALRYPMCIVLVMPVEPTINAPAAQVQALVPRSRPRFCAVSRHPWIVRAEEAGPWQGSTVVEHHGRTRIKGDIARCDVLHRKREAMIRILTGHLRRDACPDKDVRLVAPLKAGLDLNGLADYIHLRQLMQGTSLVPFARISRAPRPAPLGYRIQDRFHMDRTCDRC